MIFPQLCRERLERIYRVLDQRGGALAFRTFLRTYGLMRWELTQAAELGWISFEQQKPRTGRPSLIVRRVSKPQAAKLPPPRWQIPKSITVRQWRFAYFSTMQAIKGGSSWCGGMPCYTDAYLKAFPAAKKRRAAAASMSRLLRHPNVRAARAWWYAKICHEIPRDEPMPDDAQGIWQRLRELGSWRAR